MMIRKKIIRFLILAKLWKRRWRNLKLGKLFGFVKFCIAKYISSRLCYFSSVAITKH